MNLFKHLFLSDNIRRGFWLTIRLSLVLGFFFFMMSGKYTLEDFFISLSISFLYSFILGFSQVIINDFLSTKWNWVTHTNQRVWAGIFITVLYTIPAILVIHYILFIEIQGMNPNAFFEYPTYWVHLFWTLFSLGVSAFLHARSFMLEWKKSVKQETTKQKLVAKTETAKFETLKNQIDPHFLFNSLNVLTSLIGENPNQAEKFTTKLSKIYRYVLEQRNKELIPLSEELQFARTYMELLQMRFEDAIKFTIPVSVTNSELKIVPLSLQLLLENAVKHNVVSSIKPLQISIYEEGDFLKIENNINPKEAFGNGTKVGLQNIADRYSLISRKQIVIMNDYKTFKVQLPLLTKIEEHMNVSQQNPKTKEDRAIEYVAELKSFYSHLISFIVGAITMIAINLKYSPQFQWFWFPVLGWGAGVLSHAAGVFEIPLFGKKWEERKIKEYLDKH